MVKQRVIAYIDGFNLFYSSLKGTKYKWLDIWSMCSAFLQPNQELVAIKYFSAHQFPNEIKTSSGRIIKKPKDWY